MMVCTRGILLTILLLWVTWDQVTAIPLGNRSTAIPARNRSSSDKDTSDYSGDNAIGAKGEEIEREVCDRSSVTFNQYMWETFLASRSTCHNNITIMNQPVSEDFCKRAKTIYSHMDVKLPEPDYIYSNETFMVCSNVALREQEIILSHDFLIYLKNTTAEPVEYDIVLLRKNNASSPWYEVVADRRVPENNYGWQVLNLQSYYQQLNQSTVCVLMLVNEIKNGSRSLMNRTSLEERFVIYANETECDKQAFVASHIRYANSARTKRHLDMNSISSDNNECKRLSHTVSLTEYLGQEVLYPKTVDIGRCRHVSHSTVPNSRDTAAKIWSGTQEQEEEITQQCAPTEYSSFPVIVQSDNTVVLDFISDFVIQGCTLQSL